MNITQRLPCHNVLDNLIDDIELKNLYMKAKIDCLGLLVDCQICSSE